MKNFKNAVMSVVTHARISPGTHLVQGIVTLDVSAKKDSFATAPLGCAFSRKIVLKNLNVQNVKSFTLVTLVLALVKDHIEYAPWYAYLQKDVIVYLEWLGMQKESVLRRVNANKSQFL